MTDIFTHNGRHEVRADFDGKTFDVSVQFANGTVDHFLFEIDATSEQINTLTAGNPSRLLIIKEIKQRNQPGFF